MNFVLHQDRIFPKSVEDPDEFLDDAIRVVVNYDKASASLIQRKLSIGYARSARILDQLQTLGVVSTQEGAKPREVLISSYEEFENKIDTVAIPKSEPEEYIQAKDYVPIPLKVLEETSKVESGISLHTLLSHESLKSYEGKQIAILGQAEGKPLIFDFAQSGHLLVVGNPMSKKMSWVDGFIVSLMHRETPETCQLILFDPAYYFNLYEPVPHLLTPPITDPYKALAALEWCTEEMEKRFKLFRDNKVRTFEEYVALNPAENISRIIIVLTATQELDYLGKGGALLENLSSHGHLAGIHLVIVSDSIGKSSSLKVAKSNLINRLLFRVADASDSRMFGMSGGEKLAECQALYASPSLDVPVLLTTPYISSDLLKQVITSLTSHGH